MQFQPFWRQRYWDIQPQTLFDSLKDMPAEFQEAIDLTFPKSTNSYAYLDDVLIVTKMSVELHRQKLQAILTKLDEENLGISLVKLSTHANRCGGVRV